jgi:hypothetical protein
MNNKANKSHHNTKHPHNYNKEASNSMPSNSKWSLKNLNTFQRWSLAFSVLVIVITAVYAVFAGGQWYESVKNNKSSEETLVSFQKATVIFSEIRPIWAPNIKTGEPEIKVSPYWLNVGNTQTKNLRCYFAPLIKSKVRKDGTIDDPIFSTTENIKPQQMVLGPKCGTMGSMVTLTFQDFLGINSNIIPTLWGEARYNDIFPGTKPHITQFCQHIIRMSWPKKFTPDTKILYLAVPCQTHNCMDDECNNK